MTIFEQQLFEQLAEDFISQARVAIKTKPIPRKTKAQGEFSSVVNASGKLADSLRSEITEDEVRVYALAYIDNLIYGQAPSRVETSVFEIENWMIDKGLEFNAVSVLNNLQQYGNSIFQKFQGVNSGLLDDIDLTSHIDKIKEQLILKKITEITNANNSN
jgi:hypothetical protein